MKKPVSGPWLKIFFKKHFLCHLDNWATLLYQRSPWNTVESSGEASKWTLTEPYPLKLSKPHPLMKTLRCGWKLWELKESNKNTFYTDQTDSPNNPKTLTFELKTAVLLLDDTGLISHQNCFCWLIFSELTNTDLNANQCVCYSLWTLPLVVGLSGHDSGTEVILSAGWDVKTNGDGDEHKTTQNNAHTQYTGRKSSQTFHHSILQVH